jgi:hypothetical protein
MAIIKSYWFCGAVLIWSYSLCRPLYELLYLSVMGHCPCPACVTVTNKMLQYNITNFYSYLLRYIHHTEKRH